MSLFPNLVPPSRRGEKNLERGRAAELRGDFAAAERYFRIAADAFDAHFAAARENGRTVRPSQLVMGGIAYTRIGRNEDALRVLDQALESGPVPDAYLHAGYAAAKLGLAARAVDYWTAYPDWADQRYIARALKEQAASLRSGGDPAAACTAVARAVLAQDRENGTRRLMTRGRKEFPPNRGY